MGYAWHHGSRRRVERETMLMTFYCPKCMHVRQFYIEHGEEPPTICGKLHQYYHDGPMTQNLSFEHCDGVLLPVINVHYVIPGKNGVEVNGDEL